eukprot:9474259-Pyramimonas_sp.AAC.1
MPPKGAMRGPRKRRPRSGLPRTAQGTPRRFISISEALGLPRDYDVGPPGYRATHVRVSVPSMLVDCRRFALA